MTLEELQVLYFRNDCLVIPGIAIEVYSGRNENYNNRVAVIMTISQVAALYDEQGKEYIWPVDNLNEATVLNLLNRVQLKEKFAKVNKALEQIKEDFR